MARTSETVFYESSTISSSQYEHKKNVLLVIFKSGSTYVYKDVDYINYEKFASAESQGKALNEFIKPNYEYTLLS
tara:strand:- start:204 stop:428 length:225 start_codon:yes stop_codon:yes gene_type:complete